METQIARSRAGSSFVSPPARLLKISNSEKGISFDRINLDNLSTGAYFVRLKTENNYSVAKFIKN